MGKLRQGGVSGTVQGAALWTLPFPPLPGKSLFDIHLLESPGLIFLTPLFHVPHGMQSPMIQRLISPVWTDVVIAGSLAGGH